MMRTRLRGLLTWEVAAPLGLYALVALLVALYLALAVAVHDAHDVNGGTRRDAARQITQLQRQIGHLRNEQVHGAEARGRLHDAIAALAAQIRQLGGEPVTTGGPPAATPASRSPSSRPTHKPSTSHSHSHHPAPHPSPSPTPTHLVCVLGRCPVLLPGTTPPGL